MKQTISIAVILIILFFSSCKNKQKVDTIITNAHIYTINENNDTAQSIAISNGTISAVGSNDYILNHYQSDSIVDLNGKYVYPAFADAHAHFWGLAKFLGECNLYGTTSVSEIIQRLKIFHQQNKDRLWIIGRGWDQNLFSDKSLPTKEALDSVFADIPVCLIRVDGHAIWTNSKAIELANINSKAKIEGGEILLNKNSEPSGIFLDNATSLIEKHIPDIPYSTMIKLLQKADTICQQNHLQYIHDAGLDLHQILLLDSLIEHHLIKTKIYAMASLTKENLNYFLKHGFINKDNFKVRSFKIYADGALGSRGALLKQKYADLKNDKTASQQKNDYGLLLISTDSLKKCLSLLYKNNFQVCTHAIGDSANKLVLQLYAELLKPQDDKRWRIEHAQIVDTADLWYFKKYKILPSVQPTHAISDKSWAIQRLGKDRICFAYSYQSLWKQNNILPLGTDFPVEDVSPFKTFFAAVFRCDYDLKDTTVFRPEEKLTRLQTLRGMTIDAAYAAFLEKETGSIEVGKKAEFTILDFDLMTISKEQLSQYIKSQSN